MNEKQKIEASVNEYGDLTCSCGNIPESAGFYMCDKTGAPMEPDAGSTWDEDYRCENCGAAWHIEKMTVTQLPVKVRANS